MTTVRELLTSFGIEFDDKGGKLVDARVDGLIGKFSALGPVIKTAIGGFATGLGLAGVKSFLDHTAEMGANILDVSNKLGVATDELQELRYAAELSGGSIELMDSSLTKLSRSMAEAKSGGKEQAKAFKEIGVAISEASGETRPAGDVMADVADAIRSMDDPTKRVGLAMKIFGRAGAQLIPLLREGGDGIRKMRDEAHELGAVMSKELIEASDQYDDQMVRVRKTMQGLRNTIALSIMPTATRLLEWFTDSVKAVRNYVANNKLLRAGLELVRDLLQSKAAAWLLVAAGLYKAVGALRIILPLLARIAWPVTLVLALVAAVDDLHALFTGGKSFIGAWLDELFGIGTAQLVVDSFTAGWEMLINGIADSIGVVADWATQATQWFGETFSQIQEAGEGLMLWLEDTFGVGFVDTLRQAGRDAMQALLYPFEKAGELLGKLFGFDAQDLSRALEGSTFNEMRTRQRTTGPGVNAPLLAGPSAGQANAARNQALQASATSAPRARAGARVSVRAPVTVNVNGAKDPAAVGDEVARRLREHDERAREDAYEALDRTEEDDD